MHKQRSKSSISMLEARKLVVEKLRDSPDVIPATLAAGGLAPSPAIARTKFTMLPTATTLVATAGGGGELNIPTSGIFASAASTHPHESNNNNNNYQQPGLQKSVNSSSQFGADTFGAGGSASGGTTRGATDTTNHTGAFGDGSVRDVRRGGGYHDDRNQPPRYKEHSVKEYRSIMDEYRRGQWGGLGPNDSEEAERLRQARQKVQEYGKCVTQLNLQVVKALSPEPHATQSNAQVSGSGEVGRVGHSSSQMNAVIPRRLTEEAELARLKRQRALDFADAVADRVRVTYHHHRAPSSAEVAAVHNSKQASSSSPLRQRTASSPGELSPEAEKSLSSSPPPPEAIDALADLHRLEERHRFDLEKIAALKRQLGLLPQQRASPA